MTTIRRLTVKEAKRPDLAAVRTVRWSPNEQSFDEQRRNLERWTLPAIDLLTVGTLLHVHPSDQSCEGKGRGGACLIWLPQS